MATKLYTPNTVICTFKVLIPDELTYGLDALYKIATPVGSRNKPRGKSYVCKNCGHKSHRDANASFNIARRGWLSICGNGDGLNVPSSGRLDAALSGKVGRYV